MALKVENIIYLARNAAPGNSDAVAIVGRGNKRISVYGNFTTVQIEVLSGDGTIWVPLQNGLWDNGAEARVYTDIPRGASLRAAIVGGTSTTVEITK